MTAGSDLGSYFSVNVQACEHVLAAAALLQKQPRVLVVGSAAEYGITSGTHEVVDEQRPLQAITAYGISKIMQENGRCFTTLRSLCRLSAFGRLI